MQVPLAVSGQPATALKGRALLSTDTPPLPSASYCPATIREFTGPAVSSPALRCVTGPAGETLNNFNVGHPSGFRWRRIPLSCLSTRAARGAFIRYKVPGIQKILLDFLRVLLCQERQGCTQHPRRDPTPILTLCPVPHFPPKVQGTCYKVRGAIRSTSARYAQETEPKRLSQLYTVKGGGGAHL